MSFLSRPGRPLWWAATERALGWGSSSSPNCIGLTGEATFLPSSVTGSDSSGEKSAVHVFKLCSLRTAPFSTSSWDHCGPASQRALLLLPPARSISREHHRAPHQALPLSCLLKASVQPLEAGDTQGLGCKPGEGATLGYLIHDCTLSTENKANINHKRNKDWILLT